MKWLDHNCAQVLMLLWLMFVAVCFALPPTFTVPAKAPRVQSQTAAGGGLPTNGLGMWFEADVFPAGTSDDTAVIYWTNQGFNALHAQQATEAARPTYKTSILNGKPVIRFDGGDYALLDSAAGTNFVSSSAGTYFIVLKQTGSDAQGSSFGWVPAAGNAMRAFTTYDDVIYFDAGDSGSGGRISVAQPSGWDDNWKLLELYRSGATGEIYVNGASIHSGTFSDDIDATVNGVLSIGSVDSAGGVAFTGDIAAILGYMRDLTSQERSDVRTYLNTKYAVY